MPLTARQRSAPPARLLTLALLMSTAAAASGAAASEIPDLARAVPLVELRPFTGKLEAVSALANAGDGSGRLFVVEQPGRVLIHDGSKVLEQPFLDLSSRPFCCEEHAGLTGLAFHPSYAANGHFFVAYTESGGASIVARFSVSADPDLADPASELVILRVEQPGPYHNLGHLAFGPDGYLYIGSGDGGADQEPSQDLGSLLGKILRIDVDSDQPYAVPADNPLLSVAGVRGEIWAAGLRNPWRFSFDRVTGDLFIGDVGNDLREEIDFEEAGSGGGSNYGWPLAEGSHCHADSEACGDLIPPILEYLHLHDHEQQDCGAAVVGGYRYRGPPSPSLDGLYLFADLCTGRIWGALPNRAGQWKATLLADGKKGLVTFGEDERGNLYAAYRTRVYRLVGRPLLADGFDAGTPRGWSAVRGPLRVVQPGLDGSAGALEVPLGGRPRRRFLRSDHPEAEGTFRVAFDLDPRRVDLADGEAEILRLGDSRPHARLMLRQRGRRYWVELHASGDEGPPLPLGRVRVPERRATRIALHWLQATDPEGADGEVSLLKNGRVRVVADGLRNGHRTADRVWLGLPSGWPAGGSGSFLIDGFVSGP